MRLLLLFLATSTFMGCQASAIAEAKKSVDDGINACVAAKTDLRGRLQALHSACSDDSECVPVAQVWIGCEGWRNINTPLPKGAEGHLYVECTGVPSLGLNCSGNVGACVADHCTGRGRAGTDCVAATASLVQRASTPTACQEDGDCDERWFNRSVYPVGSRFDVVAAREIHALTDSCDEEARSILETRDVSSNVPRCIANTCAMGPSLKPPPNLERPALVDPTCVVDHLTALVTGMTGTGGKATVKFVVGPNGKSGAFEFLGPVPRGLYDRIIWGIVGCKWKPGRRDGQPIPMWVIQPINFK
jgi:hypothetical protein